MVTKKFSTLQEATAYVRTLPLDYVIAIAAQSMVITPHTVVPRITITEDQLNRFFKIRGINDDGQRETRGRKPKEK